MTVETFPETALLPPDDVNTGDEPSRLAQYVVADVSVPVEQAAPEPFSAYAAITAPAWAARIRIGMTINAAQQRLHEIRTTNRGPRRVMAYVGGLALSATFLLTAYAITRSTMAPVEASGLLHDLYIPLVHDGLTTPPANDHASPVTMQLAAYETTDSTTIADEAVQLADPYPDTREAVGSDPLANGHASNVTMWSIDAMQHELRASGVPEDVVQDVSHDQRNINMVNQGFYDDPNPNNQLVADASNHFLDKHDVYSLVGQDAAAKVIAADVRHELGLDVPPPASEPPLPVAPTLPGLATQFPSPEATPANAASWIIAARAAVADFYTQNQMLLLSAGGATALGGASLGVRKLNRHNRRRQFNKENIRSHGGYRTGDTRRQRSQAYKAWRASQTKVGVSRNVRHSIGTVAHATPNAAPLQTASDPAQTTTNQRRPSPKPRQPDQQNGFFGRDNDEIT